ncbi:FtsK/SpoIIIE domain-containing protein [Amedibacillus sp. YH-ame6]
MDEEKLKTQLYIYGFDQLEECILPKQKEGRFWIYHSVNKERVKLIEVMARKKKWYFVQHDECRINEEKEHFVEVKNEKRFILNFQKHTVFLFSFAYERVHHQYKAFTFTRRLQIGRGDTCDIVYAHEAVSTLHASLYYDDDGFWIVDEQSSNGVYVNGKRIKKQSLKMKDCIQILQLKILIGPTCIFMNEVKQVSKKTSICTYQFSQMSACKRKDKDIYTWVEKDAFHFQKRMYTIDTYPAPFDRKQMPMIFLLGPAVTMGLSSLSMGVFSLLQALQQKQEMTQVMPTLIMSFSMATGTILWPLLTRLYEKKLALKQNQVRNSTYVSYLNEMQNRMYEEIHAYETMLRTYHLTTTRYIELFLEHTLVANHKDDCSVTLGIGDIPYTLQMEKPREEFKLYQDLLQEELEKITLQSYYARNVPVVIDLKKHRYVQVDGEDASVFMLDLLFQMVLAYQNDIKIVVCMNTKLAHVNKIAFMPQIFSEDGSIRYLVSDEQDGKLIYSTLEEEMATSTKVYAFFIFNGLLASKLQMKTLLANEHCICFKIYDSFNNHVNIIPTKIQVASNQGYVHQETTLRFTYQLTTKRSLCAFQLANQRSGRSTRVRLPKSYHLLEMYECGNVEQLNVWERWQNNDVSDSLEVRIGINAYHEPLYLDAHERYHGPHGLFAGMTGSGKSECLLTYILSLAICFSPEDVSFLLIDYKGGTMAKSCGKLPHIAGIVTNLDQDIIQRSCMSLRSELQRRQQLFAQACLTYDVGNMNIETYRKLCKKYEHLPKLSHLFIIADEFAELKSQQPEFLEQLKQSARIGRSLGIHLLLATQKPSGVIDDQIWSNAHFHLCMKVQSIQDSQDMLRKEDAAYLKRAGECCLQVGLDEIYEKGLIAWSQYSYFEREEVEKHTFDEIAILKDTGDYQSTQHISPLNEKTDTTQMDAVVEHMVHIAKRQHLYAQSLWKESLSQDMYVKEYPKAIGIIDDVENQKQFPFLYDQVWISHLLVYGKSTSDRETLLKTLLYQIIQEEHVHMYIFDFDQHHLLCFQHRACICDVVIETQREKVESFFYQMKTKKQEDKIEEKILVVHNYEAFHELYEEYEKDLLYLLREHAKLHFRIYISASNPSTVSYRIQQYISSAIAFSLHEQNDYRMIFSGGCPFYPTNKGSGLLQYQQRILNFQVLQCTQEDIEQLPYEKGNLYQIPVLPKQVRYPIEDISKGLYLGKQVDSKEDVFCTFSHHIHYVICAFRFLSSFLYVTFQQLALYRKDVYVVHDETIDNDEELMMKLEDEKEHIFIWKRPYQFTDFKLQEYLREKLMEDHHKHIFLYTMKEHSYYLQYDWFQDSLYDAFLLWMGKGFKDYAYMFKCQNIASQELKANQAYLMEEDTCIKLQLWEVT